MSARRVRRVAHNNTARRRKEEAAITRHTAGALKNEKRKPSATDAGDPSAVERATLPARPESRFPHSRRRYDHGGRNILKPLSVNTRRRSRVFSTARTGRMSWRHQQLSHGTSTAPLSRRTTSVHGDQANRGFGFPLTSREIIDAKAADEDGSPSRCRGAGQGVNSATPTRHDRGDRRERHAPAQGRGGGGGGARRPGRGRGRQGGGAPESTGNPTARGGRVGAASLAAPGRAAKAKGGRPLDATQHRLTLHLRSPARRGRAISALWGHGGGVAVHAPRGGGVCRARGGGRRRG